MSSQKFTLILDSSQITTILKCPQKWYFQYIKRLVPSAYISDKDEVPMNAGTYGHKLLDIYYRNKVKGVCLNDNIEACMSYDPDKDTCECGCVREMHKAVPLLGIQECQRCNKCATFRPKPFPLPLETRNLVRNRFKDYIFKYQRNDLEPLSENHVEVGFSETILEDDENLFVLEGRIDMIAKLQGVSCIVDHKFQMQTHWLYPNSVQFKNYAMVGKANLMIINYVRLQQKMTDTSLARDLVNFTAPQLRAWKERLVQVYFGVKSLVLSQTGQELYRNWDSCSGYGKTFSKDFPKYCWYNPICEEPSPLMAERKETQLYKVQQEVWRPW